MEGVKRCDFLLFMFFLTFQHSIILLEIDFLSSDHLSLYCVPLCWSGSFFSSSAFFYRCICLTSRLRYFFDVVSYFFHPLCLSCKGSWYGLVSSSLLRYQQSVYVPIELKTNFLDVGFVILSVSLRCDSCP